MVTRRQEIGGSNRPISSRMIQRNTGKGRRDVSHLTFLLRHITTDGAIRIAIKTGWTRKDRDVDIDGSDLG